MLNSAVRYKAIVGAAWALMLSLSLPALGGGGDIDIPWIGSDGTQSWDFIGNWTGGNVPDNANENPIIGDATADRTITLPAAGPFQTIVGELQWTQNTSGVTQRIVLERNFETDTSPYATIANNANPGDGSNMIFDLNGFTWKRNQAPQHMTAGQIRYETSMPGGIMNSDSIGIGEFSSVGPGVIMEAAHGSSRSRGAWDITSVIRGTQPRFDFDQIVGPGLANLEIGGPNYNKILEQVTNIGEYNRAGNPARINGDVTIGANGRLEYWSGGGRNIIVGGNFTDSNNDAQNYDGADDTLTFASGPASPRTVGIDRSLQVNIDVGFGAEAGDIVLDSDLTTGGTFRILYGSKVNVGVQTLSTGNLEVLAGSELEFGFGSNGQIAVTGTAALFGNLTLDLSTLTSFTDPIILIDNDGVDPLAGEFANAPDGTTYASPFGNLELVYNFNGNDLALAGGAGLACDFTSDSLCNDADIDLLAAAVRNGTSNPQFNVDGVGGNVPDLADFDFYITDDGFLGTGLGDHDLNMLVNFNDFVALSNSFGSSGTGWSEGNGNTDDVTNFNDFVRLGNNFGSVFTSAPNVPEPGVLTLVAAATGLFFVARRR